MDELEASSRQIGSEVERWLRTSVRSESVKTQTEKWTQIRNILIALLGAVLTAILLLQFLTLE